MKAVGNDRENTLTIPAPVFFWPGTVAGTGKPDRKTNLILQDIGNGKFRSGTCGLRSGIDNTKWEHRYM